MSTRSNVIINDGRGEPLYIYRHRDGYLANTGLDLFCLCDKANKDGEFFKHRLFNNFTHDYETTTEIHGDSQFVYHIEVVEVDGKNQRKLKYMERKRDEIVGGSYWTNWQEITRDLLFDIIIGQLKKSGPEYNWERKKYWSDNLQKIV